MLIVKKGVEIAHLAGKGSAGRLSGVAARSSVRPSEQIWRRGRALAIGNPAVGGWRRIARQMTREVELKAKTEEKTRMASNDKVKVLPRPCGEKK